MHPRSVLQRLLAGRGRSLTGALSAVLLERVLCNLLGSVDAPRPPLPGAGPRQGGAEPAARPGRGRAGLWKGQDGPGRAVEGS